MLAVFTVLFSMLGFYLDQVVPSPYGVAKPWNFLCKRQAKENQTSSEEAQALLQGNSERDARNFEAVPEVLRRQEANTECIRVRGLKKNFGPKKAVQGVDLDIYKG